MCAYLSARVCMSEWKACISKWMLACVVKCAPPCVELNNKGIGWDTQLETMPAEHDHIAAQQCGQ